LDRRYISVEAGASLTAIPGLPRH